MAKAIAIRTIYLVVVIAMIVSFTIIGLVQFTKSGIELVTQALCAVRANSYCDECKRGQCPGNWDEFAPGCTEIGIDEPSMEACGISLADCSSECGNRNFATGTCRTTTIPTNGKMTHGIMHAPGDSFLDKMWDDSKGEFTDKFKRQIDQVADIGIDFFYLTFHAGNGEKSFWKSGDKSTLRSECEVIDRSRANPFTGQMTERCKMFLDKVIPYILDKDMKITLYMWLRGSGSFWDWLGRDSSSINKIEDYIIPFWKTLTQYLKDKNYPYDKVILGPIFGNVGSGWGWPDYNEQKAVDWWTPIMKKVVDEIHSVDSNRIVIASPIPDWGGKPLFEDPPHGGRWLPIGPAETVWYRVMIGKTQGGGTLEPVSSEPCKANYDTDPSKNEDYPIEEGEIGIAWHQNQYGVTVVTEELKPFPPFIRENFCPDWDWEYRNPEAYDWLRDWLPKRDEIGVGWMWEGANGFRTWLGESFFNDDGSEKPFVDIIREYLTSSKSTVSSSSKYPAKTITWADGTTETIQVGDKGKIYLNGKEVKAFGFSFFGWLSIPDAAMENILDWMDTEEVRFVDIYFYPNVGGQTGQMDFYFPKFYAHKKFVRLILFMGETYNPFDSNVIAGWKSGFNTLIDHIDNNDWEDMVYTVQPTHEIDWYAKKHGKTVQEMSNALDEYDSHARNRLSTSDIGSVPIIHANNGLDHNPDNHPWVKKIIEKSDIAVRDTYPGNAEYLVDTALPTYRSLMADVGKDPANGYKIWYEFGRHLPGTSKATYVPVEMLTALLGEPDTADVFLFYVYKGWDPSPEVPTWYFDTNGNPESWTEALAPYFPKYETIPFTSGCADDETAITDTCESGKVCCCSGTAPTPTTTENIFGVFVWRGVSDRELDYARDLGVYWVEIGQSGRFDWRNDPVYVSQIGDLVNRIRARGMEPIFWFNSNDDSLVISDYDGFANFVADFVQRFDISVAVIQDEPHGFWSGTQEEYVEVFRRVYPAVKAVKPDTVIVGAFGYGRFFQIYESNFPLDSLRKLGLLDYVDALSIHGFTGNHVPEEFLIEPHTTFRNYLDNAGYPNIKLYVTGFGYTLEFEVAAGGPRTEAEQADLTVRTAEIFHSFPDVDAISYFYLEPDPTGTYSQKGGTLLNHDTGEPRPVYYAYKDFIAETVPPDGDWGFIPEGYEIVFADDVEQTTWDGSTGDNPNLQPWVSFFTGVHNDEILHKQILSDSQGLWYGDGNDWYSTTVVRRGNRAFRVHRPGQVVEGHRMQLMSRFHTEYVWYGTWIYLPEDFELDKGWFTFGGTLEMATVGDKRHELWRELTLTGKDELKVNVNYRRVILHEDKFDNGYWFTGISLGQYRGQWVRIGYLVRWHKTEGYMKFYLNGEHISTFDKYSVPEIEGATMRWDATTFFIFTMKHYSHEHDYETVYWDDLVFAVPEGTTDW